MPLSSEERATRRRQVQAEYRARIRLAEEERKQQLREQIYAYATRLPPPSAISDVVATQRWKAALDAAVAAAELIRCTPEKLTGLLERLSQFYPASDPQ